MKASEKMEPLFDKAIKELTEYMDGTKAGSDKTKTAQTIITNFRGLKSQENNERATKTAHYRFQYLIIKDFAKNKEELKKITKKMIPESKLIQSSK